jgi:hypothetical protein
MNVNAQFLGSTRVSHVGFGVAPKQAFLLPRRIVRVKSREEVRDREDALASTRDARAPQKTL